MKVFSTTTDIHATPETIWGILMTGNLFTEWDPGMVSLKGTIAPGNQLEIRTKIAPDQLFKPTVTEFEPNRKMVWSSGMPLGLFRGARTFELEPLGENLVKFSMREEFSGLLLPLFPIPDLSATFAAFSAALKERAERR